MRTLHLQLAVQALSLALVVLAQPPASNGIGCQCLDPQDNNTPNQQATDDCCVIVAGVSNYFDCVVSLLAPVIEVFEACCEINELESVCN